MAEKKSADAGLVAKVPCVVWRDTEGRQHTVYKGAPIPADAVDPEHLKLLKEDGSVGSPDKSE